MGSSLRQRRMRRRRVGSLAKRTCPAGRRYSVTTPQTSSMVQCSVPRMLPSPIRVMSFPWMSMMRCRTKCPGAISAKMASSTCSCCQGASFTRSLRCSRKGRMLYPLTKIMAVSPRWIYCLTRGRKRSFWNSLRTTVSSVDSAYLCCLTRRHGVASKRANCLIQFFK